MWTKLIVFVLLVTAALACFWVVAQSIRAEPARYACEAKRMDYRRYSFSSTVICVPKALDTRSDTLTIQR